MFSCAISPFSCLKYPCNCFSSGFFFFFHFCCFSVWCYCFYWLLQLAFLFILGEFFVQVLTWCFSLASWWQQVSLGHRTLQSIVAIIAVIWMVLIKSPISYSSCLFFEHFKTILSTLTTIVIIISFIFHSFSSSLEKDQSFYIRFHLSLLCIPLEGQNPFIFQWTTEGK